jgi:hypothetical protein
LWFSSQAGVSIRHREGDHLVWTCYDAREFVWLLFLTFDDSFDNGLRRVMVAC